MLKPYIHRFIQFHFFNSKSVWFQEEGLEPPGVAVIWTLSPEIVPQSSNVHHKQN